MELLNQECLYTDVDGILSSLCEVVNKRIGELDRIVFRGRLETQYCQQFLQVLKGHLMRTRAKEKLLSLKQQ